MIKFWKSAAKGKSGCPVRPPENQAGNPEPVVSLMRSNINEEKDSANIFDKNSKLSISLHDILEKEIGIKYFIQFMELIGQQYLIKCWLQLENFKTLASNTKNDNVEQHSKIIRAKSFDLQNARQTEVCCRNKSNRLSWKGSSEFCTQNSMQENICSYNSLDNPVEHPGLLKSCNICKHKDCNNLTEVAINLFKKYVALEAPVHIDLPDNVRKSVISNICQPEGHINNNCFAPVQKILFDNINKMYFSEFQKSPLYVKAQIDILTSESISLKDILFNECILFYFTEYLEQESCSILLQFLISVMHYRDNLTSETPPSPEQAQADAIVLYDKYFSLQATNPIGFSSDVRLNIESDICREEGPLYSCFDLPYQIVFKTLECNVRTFLESEIYYKYLSEMIHSVDQRWSFNKSQSDCSSEFSISTQNTLLAMGDPVFRKKKRNLSVPDMTIDSKQLYNADALWQRKKQDGLSLGRVNSLGRFESKLEPDPDKKDKSVLRKMVSRFVPMNTTKVEEEMAWQIAHMIIKDVTDLTMAPPDNERDEV